MKKILFLFFSGITAYAQSVEITPNSTKSINSGGIYSANPTMVSGNPTPTAPVSGAGTRLMWIPSRSAFRVGSVNGAHWNADSIGLFSMATGYNTRASGIASTAIGANTRASGDLSTAMGSETTALGIGSTAMGHSTNASGNASTAMGNETTASGLISTAIGYQTTASGDYSTAMGYGTSSLEDGSTALGWNTSASEKASTAMGRETTASGITSTAMGYATTASGANSTAMGGETNASGIASTAMGYATTASGDYSTAMGSRVSTNTKTGAFVIGDEYTGSKPLIALTANRFYARFRNGYTFYTNANNSIGAQLGANASAWATISDSTRKENFLPAHTEAVLQSVAQMRVGTWNYKGQDPAQYRHWGVMAQDFYHHFGKDPYGTIGNDTTIATADFDGVAFAALKGLEARTRALGSKDEILSAQYSELATRNSELETKYSLLTTHYSELETSLRQAQGDNAHLRAQYSALETRNSELVSALREDLSQLRALVESLIAKKNRPATGQLTADH